MAKVDPRIIELHGEHSYRAGKLYDEFMLQHPELDSDDPDWPQEATDALKAYTAEEDARFEAACADLQKVLDAEHGDR